MGMGLSAAVCCAVVCAVFWAVLRWFLLRHALLPSPRPAATLALCHCFPS